jgi:hypothetical protein
MTGPRLTDARDATLRRLERENEALRARLAAHEFRRMERELASGAPFRLDIAVGAAEAPADLVLPPVEGARLPRLPVPPSAIERERPSPDHPVIAIWDEGLTGRPLAAALGGLLKAQYRAPFARLVFLCATFEAVPFLGRYGFVAEHVGPADPATRLDRLHQRFGVTQIRAVGSGQLIAETRDR